MFTSKVRTVDRKLLQEPNLNVRQPGRAPHHVIQATTSEGLAQGPYVAARVRFEPATLRMQGTEPLNHHAPKFLPALCRRYSALHALMPSKTAYSQGYGSDVDCARNMDSIKPSLPKPC